MGTVDSFEKCPQCGHEQLYTSFQTRTMEDQRFCFACGFRAWTTLVKDHTTQKPKLSKSGKWMFRYYERPGHGTYQASFENGSGTIGNFKQALSDKQVDECIQTWKDTPSAMLTYLSRWTDHLEILVNLRTEEELYGC